MVEVVQWRIIQAEVSQSFMMKVFSLVAWVFGVTGLAILFSPEIAKSASWLFNPMINFFLCIWIILSAWVWARTRPLNLILFYSLSFLLWLTLYPYLVAALQVWWSIMVVKAFVATACLTLAAWMYWASTKADLSWIRGFLMVGLIWVIIVSLMQLFWPSDQVTFLVNLFSVGLFSAFIAYEVNMLKFYPESMAIEASIGLYLSIFNLFRSILWLMPSLSSDR